MTKILMRMIGMSTLAAVVVVSLPIMAEAGSANTYKPDSVGAPLEVTLTDDGRANVHGARVISVDADTFTAETIWGAGRLTWKVRADSGGQWIIPEGSGRPRA